jgi:DNA-binding NarL/FixJ family response regulator
MLHTACVQGGYRIFVFLQNIAKLCEHEGMTQGTSPIRILMVDDHTLLREGIAELIADETDMVLVGEAGNGREAIEQFRKHHPDVTLMDLQMPKMCGLDAMIAIRGEFPEARMIVLTTYMGDVQVLRALKAGARAYLLKNTLRTELLRTIRAVHEGDKSLSPEVSFQLAEHVAEETLSPHCRREFQQRNRERAVSNGGHHQRPGQEHSCKIKCPRSHARRDDRGETRHYRALTKSVRTDWTSGRSGFEGNPRTPKANEITPPVQRP